MRNLTLDPHLALRVLLSSGGELRCGRRLREASTLGEVPRFARDDGGDVAAIPSTCGQVNYVLSFLLAGAGRAGTTA